MAFFLYVFVLLCFCIILWPPDCLWLSPSYTPLGRVDDWVGPSVGESVTLRVPQLEGSWPALSCLPVGQAPGPGSVSWGQGPRSHCQTIEILYKTPQDGPVSGTWTCMLFKRGSESPKSSSDLSGKKEWDFQKKIFFLIYFWLRSVPIAARKPSLVAESRGHSSLLCAGPSLRWPPLLRGTGSRAQAQ